MAECCLCSLKKLIGVSSIMCFNYLSVEKSVINRLCNVIIFFISTVFSDD